MNAVEKLIKANSEIESQWGLMQYALFNLNMQAKHEISAAIYSAVKDNGPRAMPVAGNLKSADRIKQRINTATLIAVKLGGYTYEQMVSEWKFETGQTFKS